MSRHFHLLAAVSVLSLLSACSDSTSSEGSAEGYSVQSAQSYASTATGEQVQLDVLDLQSATVGVTQ